MTYLGQQRKSLVFDLCLWRCRRKYAEDACICFLGLKSLQCSDGTDDCEFQGEWGRIFEIIKRPETET